MTEPTIGEVEAALDRLPESSGAIIVGPGPGHRLLAARDAHPGGAAVLIVLGGKPFAYPPPDQRPRSLVLPSREPGSRGAQAASRPDRPARRGKPPASRKTRP